LPTVLVLLPPSEAKAAGGRGGPVDLERLSWPELGPVRRRVGDVLSELCRDHPAAARATLGLSSALDGDRAADAALWESRTMRAGARYTGVLHQALGWPTLPGPARSRANRSLVVLSGLWGATRPTDRLPAYRIGIATRLPGLPTLPALWHRPLGEALDDEVAASGALDLRSAGYSRLYRPTGRAASRLVAVRMAGPDGRRAAPSYASKLAKGSLVRAMLLTGLPTAAGLVAAADTLGLAADIATTGGTITVRVPAGWDPGPTLGS
jgi:hypothetical protein